MKNRTRWLLLLLVVLLVGGLIARTLVSRDAARQAASTPPPVAVLSLAAGDIVRVVPTQLTRTLPVSGNLRALNSALLKAKVAAEVKSLTVREGDRVQAGQVLGQLDTTELDLRLRQAQQSASASNAQLDITRRTLENNRALVAQGFISPTGLETSVANEAAARANHAGALAAVELARKARQDATLVAPISGVVSQRFVQPGERVGVEARLVEIVDLTQLELEVALNADDVADVQVGQSATLDIGGFSTPIGAKVARINPSTQAGTRSVLVYLELASHPGLRQGLFAQGHIAIDEGRTALLVPRTAVRIDQAQPYVQAVDNGQVKHVVVQLGTPAQARLSEQSGAPEEGVEVTQGVSPGMVVLRGTVGRLREGTPVELPQQASSAPAPAPIPERSTSAPAHPSSPLR